MEYHLISKVLVMWKTLILILFSAMLFAGLQSCEDSIGIDPDNRIDEIPGKDTTKNPNIYEITDYNLFATEIFGMAQGHRGMVQWGKESANINRGRIVIDTSDVVPLLYVEEYQLQSLVDLQIYEDYGLLERVQSVYLNVRDLRLRPGEVLYLNGNDQSDKFMRVQLENVNNFQSSELNGSDYSAVVEVLSVNKKEGIVDLAFGMNTRNTSPRYLSAFELIIRIFYKG